MTSPPQPCPKSSIEAGLRSWPAEIATPFSVPPTPRHFSSGQGWEIGRVGPAKVREFNGVEPRQVPDFIALRGDPSDKLPGAPGVGPKGAAAVLRRYGMMEQAIVEGRFIEQSFIRNWRQCATAPLPQFEGSGANTG